MDDTVDTVALLACQGCETVRAGVDKLEAEAKVLAEGGGTGQLERGEGALEAKRVRGRVERDGERGADAVVGKRRGERRGGAAADGRRRGVLAEVGAFGGRGGRRGRVAVVYVSGSFRHDGRRQGAETGANITEVGSFR